MENTIGLKKEYSQKVEEKLNKYLSTLVGIIN